MQPADRLTRPLARDGGELRDAGWDEAMERIVGRLRELLDETGPGGLGFYSRGTRGSGPTCCKSE